MSTASLPTDIRYVFDSTVYIAAALRPGEYCDRLIKRAAKGEFRLFVSGNILDEVAAKLAGKHELDSQDISHVLSLFTTAATLVYPTVSLSVPKLRDQNDLHILECAVAAKAHLIITADKDLLKLKQFQTIKIAHPSMMKFWYK